MTVMAFPARQPDLPVPEADEAEKSVLGALLLQPDAVQLAQESLRSEVFRLDRHRAVWDAIVAVAGAGRAVDFVTVLEELTNRGKVAEVGGVGELTKLVDGRTRATNMEHYAGLVLEAHQLRSLQAFSWSLLRSASNEVAPAMDILSKAERELREMQAGGGAHGLHAGPDVEAVLCEQLRAGMEFTGGVTGLSTGFACVDRLTSGWQPGELIIIAGRPGSGKTSFAGATIWDAATHGHPTLFASIEMSTPSVSRRLACLDSFVPYAKARDPRWLTDLEMRRYQSSIAKLGASAIYLDDTARTVADVRRLARMTKARAGRLALIVVDYLQLLKAERGKRSDSRSREVGEMTGEFKALAKEEACPVIVLSQLSRDCEKRTKEGRPMLSDLRDSGEIEQDADFVGFLYRPSKYDESKPEDIAEFIIAKQRNGAPTNLEMKWTGDCMRYDSLERR